MRADLRACEPSPAQVEQMGRERPAEPPCVAQGACCGDCRSFSVLDDRPLDMDKWFGVCLMAARHDLMDETDWGAVLDWTYASGRHGSDAACDHYEEA